MRRGPGGERGRHAGRPRGVTRGGATCGARRRQAAARRAGRGRRPADDRQPREAQRARPRDPRRDAPRCAGPRRPLRDPHRLEGMFSAGYDIGDMPEDELRRARPRSSSPIRSPPRIDALEAYPFPTSRRSAATRSAAAWSWRSSATCASPPTGSSSGCRPPSSGSSTRTRGCGSSSTRSARRARASCSSRAATSTPRTALRLGPRQRASSLRGRARGGALELAAEIARNAPLSLRGNKRVIGEMLVTRGAHDLGAEIERQLVELRESCFISKDMPRGRAAFAEKRPPDAGSGR